MAENKIRQEEANPNEPTPKYYKLDFSNLARLVVQDLNTDSGGNILFSNFSKEQAMRALQNPQRNERDLRNLSNFLYIASPHYKRLCDYHAEMLLLDWYISPLKLDVDKVNEKQFVKAYRNTLNMLDNMNIKHEFGKALKIAFREGVFYGYEYKTDNSYFLQKLDPEFCRISSIVDGVYNFEFNFQYFDADESRLENYAPEFTTKYNLYKNSRQNRGANGKRENLQWQELDHENTVCIKTDEDIPYPFPPFIGVLPDIYEIQDYKALKKANNEMQNIAIFSGKIPYKEKSDIANDFKLTLDTAMEFGNKIITELPDQVGFMLSVFEDMELFKLSDDKVGTDKVEEAVNNFWSSSGVSKNLFTDSGNTDAAMRYSITTDEQTVLQVLRQIERWINRKLKEESGKYKFKINMLDTTRYNQTLKITEELKAAQFGIPNKTKLFATMGGSQSEMEGMTFLENEILQLHDNWIPLKSSHTSSESPTGGENKRPSKEEDETRIDDDGGDEE